MDFGAILNDKKTYTEKVNHEENRKEALARVEEKASSQKTIEAMARADLYYLKDGEILIIDGEDAEK
jgi:cell division protein FtsB